ncbi:MAG: helix-turn-helix domain-containing protein [Clostridiales bacterium]|nr:helix-turn-helix domain-containing protein [Clostridiales bacterium]
MSKFSGCLKRLFEASGESIASVARDIGAERTSIHKALTDERVLPYRVVQALAGHFRLTLEEREEFFQYYEMLLQGEDAWSNQQAICDLFNHLADVRFAPSAAAVQPERPFDNATLVEGEYAVRGAILSILAWETSQGEDITIQMFLPSGLNISQELLELWMTGAQFHVDELFCSPVVTGNNCSRDIHLLERIIPLCLVSCGAYAPYYFRERTGTQDINPLNYYIITPNYLIHLSQEQSAAVVHTRKPLIRLFSNHFQRLLERCDLLTNCTSSILDVLQKYTDATNPDTSFFMLIQPCFGRYVTSNYIQKYLRTDGTVPLETLYSVGDRRFSALRKVEKNYYTVFSEEGLQLFIETGIMIEMPPEFVPPLEPADRLVFLTKLHREMEIGTVIGLIVRPSYLRLPDYMEAYVDADGCIHFDTTNRFLHGAYCCDIRISEEYLCRAFQQFFRSLPSSKMVYPKEDALRILDEGISKLKNLSGQNIANPKQV